MKKVFMLVILIMILTACSHEIKPIQVIKTEFDLSEAEIIMKRAWEPVHEMTNENLETKPDIQISSKEEFFNIYDFTYMDDRFMRSAIYENIVDIEENRTEVKDENGNLKFGEAGIIHYIPNIYDEGIFIKKAYIRDSRYEEEYDFNNVVELVVVEMSNDKVDDHVLGFSRDNIFRKNEKGEWVLYMIEGTMSISWDK